MVKPEFSCVGREGGSNSPSILFIFDFIKKKFQIFLIIPKKNPKKHLNYFKDKIS